MKFQEWKLVYNIGMFNISKQCGHSPSSNKSVSEKSLQPNDGMFGRTYVKADWDVTPNHCAVPYHMASVDVVGTH